MTVTRSWWGIAAAAALAFGNPLAAQEFALKGAVTISQFAASGSGENPFDDKLPATGFGGHVRFRFGRIALQPEVQVVTRGARVSTTELEDEQLRLEYLELPVLLVLPVRVGRLEPYAFGGGMVAVETRCRYMLKDDGLRSNFGCDVSDGGLFERRKVDYGVVAGGGASYPVGSGRIFIDVRHTWGMRNIVDEDIDVELRNRTLTFALGYTITTTREQR